MAGHLSGLSFFMKQLDHASSIELGRWLGRRDAFAAVAGKCSAAEAESLRKIRSERLYLQLDSSWEGFCKNRLGVSRRHVDRILRLLDEFGPAYFLVAQMTHVTPDEYRAIAPHVSAEGVRLDGAVVALLPENSQQVSAAIADLIEREKPAKSKPAVSFDAALQRCAALESFVRESPLQEAERRTLGLAIARLVIAAGFKGILVPRM